MKILKTIAVQIFTGANIATLLLLWGCCLVTYVPPSVMPRLSLVTLAFPVFLVANIAFVVFWLIFKVRRVWLPLAGIAACAFFVRDYYPVNMPSPPPADSWKVITYNTHAFGGKAATDADGQNSVVRYLAESNADIICLQEAFGKTYVEALRKTLTGQGYEMAQHKNQILCTRLHIISSDTLVYPTRSNGGFSALLTDGTDTIMLINNHFESNHLTPEVKKDYKDAVRHYESDSIMRELAPMFDLLTRAAPMRSQQADSVMAVVDHWLPRPVILCGDFNDTPISYVHRRLTSRLTSAYTQSGQGLGVTYHDRGFPVRIDHILFSDEHFRSYDTHVDRSLTASDHFPLVTFLTKNKEKPTK